MGDDDARAAFRDLACRSGSARLLVQARGCSRYLSSVVRDTHHTLRTSASRVGEFNKALAVLVGLGEQATIDLWESAITNPAPELRLRAWSEYRVVQSRLVRNELVPQVARIGARPEIVQRLADEDRLQVSVWSSSGEETIAAAPPRLIERLRSARISVEVVYDSIVEWQNAVANGDALARVITPDTSPPPRRKPRFELQSSTSLVMETARAERNGLATARIS